MIASLTWIGLGTATESSAQAATVFHPINGPIFNNPSGNQMSPAAFRIMQYIDNLISNTPKGEYIRISTMRLDIASTVDRLINAHKRGVNVEVIMPIVYADAPQPNRLVAELGKHRFPHDASYIKFCAGGCYNNAPYSIDHVKLYMFSRSGDRKWVSVVSSSNLTYTMYRTAFNDAYSLTSHHIYNGLRDYFTGMRADRDPKNDPYHTILTPKYAYYLFPDTTTPRSRDFFSRVLDNISCKAGGTYGDGHGHTMVDVEVPMWRANRIDMAQRLGYLEDHGCHVAVTIQKAGVDPQVQQVLLAHHIPTRFTEHYDNGVRRLYGHSKFIAISGGYRGNSKTATVFTGTSNFTITETRSSDNAILQVRNDAPILERYRAQFNLIWHHAQTLTEQVAVAAKPVPARMELSPEE